MDPYSAAIMGGTMLATGTMSSIGAHSANSANKKIAREQMNFQRIMAETQHQREVEDLRKAGLNPLLSAGGSGAAAPAGASTTVQNEYEPFAKHIDPMKIMEIQQGRANISRTRAEEAYLKSQKDLVDAQKKNIEDQNPGIGLTNTIRNTEAIKASQDRDIIDSWFGRNIVAPIRVLFSDTGTNVGSVSNYTGSKH